jgi:hypothetical protein
MLSPGQIRLVDAKAVNRHRDQWAERVLVDPVQWEATLTSTRSWSEYSAANQLLLASYGAEGAVAGAETWRMVPSIDGRTCAIRQGEHGLPVRVPVVAPSTDPDPHLGGQRPTRTAAAGWEWRPVFCEAQLARRPAPGALSPVNLPDALTGPRAGERWLAVTRTAAAKTVRGRLPRSDDAVEVLTQAAGRLPRSGQRPPLEEPLRSQVAWLVADRVGHASGPLPGFDPGALAPRERWNLLLDVLEPARKLTDELGRATGVNLLAPLVPKMRFDDDRLVAPERRNRLPRASLEQLPLNEWHTVGPYSPDEWATRGEVGDGRAAYRRLNSSAYLVAIEQGDGAQWRLEDVKAREGAGLLASGPADSLTDAQATATATLAARYPQLAPSPITVTTPQPEPAPPPTTVPPEVPPEAPTAVPPVVPAGWQPFEGHTASGALHRDLGDGVRLYLFAGPEEQWLPMVQRRADRALEPLPPAASQADATSIAELEGRRAVREVRTGGRAEFDDTVAELAASPTYRRDDLATLVGARLEPAARAVLRGDPTPAQLVEVLGAAGVTARTTARVLRAEQVPAETAATLLPVAGIPIPAAIDELHHRWDIPRTTAAGLLDATATDMRTAGCTAQEIMTVRPRDVLRHLTGDPATWDLAAGSMAAAGHPAHEIVAHLASHAPDPHCFAAGITAAVDEPGVGIALAVRQGLPAEALVAASERYGMAPIDLAAALADANTHPTVSVPTVLARCDGDPTLTTQVLRSATPLRTDQIADALAQETGLDHSPAELRAAKPLSRDPKALIAAHVPAQTRPARSAHQRDMDELLDSLPEIPPDAPTFDDDLAAALPPPQPDPYEHLLDRSEP